MVTAGLTDHSSALQISLITHREMPEDYNVFEHVTGELNYELRDLAHHLIARLA